MKTGRHTVPSQLLGWLAVAVVVVARWASAEGQILTLSDEEFEANLSYRERSANLARKTVDPLAPQIYVETPHLGSDVTPPVDIIVTFSAAEDSTIDLDSLKIKYGWFDITQRVLESMSVSPNGIAGQLESMRLGKYKIRVSIGDTKQRTSNAEIEFRIVGTSAGSKD